MRLKLALIAGFALTLAATLTGCSQQGPSQEGATTSSSPPPPAEPPPAKSAQMPKVDISSPEAFTANVLKLFQSADPGGGWSMKEPLTLTNKADFVVNLERVLRLCQARTEECEKEVAHFVTTTCDVATHGDAKATAPQLVPLVRARSYLDAAPPEMRAKLLSEPLVADLIVLYAVDFDAAVRGALAQDLVDAGVARQDLPQLARRNMEAQIHTSPADVKCQGPGVQALSGGNYLESSRILLKSPWAELAADAKGPIVAAVPAGDLVLFACNPDATALAKLAEATERSFRAAERPISRTLLKWSPMGWSELRR